MSDQSDKSHDLESSASSVTSSAEYAAEAVKPEKKYLFKIFAFLFLVLLMWGGVGALGITLGWGTASTFFPFLPSKPADVIKVKLGTAVYAVYGTVKVEPVIQTIVRSQTSGVISKLNYKKGDVVKQGDILAEVADDSANQALQSAQREYENALSLREIGPPSKPARDAKERKVEQLKKLLADGNIPETEYNNNLAELRTLQDKVRSEQLALDDALKQYKQKLEGAFAGVKQMQLVSPQNGVILDIFHQLGEVLTAREQVFLVGSEECQIRAQINEEDVGVIKPGLQAIVRLYSHQGKDFKANVKEVLPQGKNQEYSVILTLEDPPTPFLPDMTGELNIIIGKHENTLIVPTRAIRGTGNAIALVVVNGEVRHAPIKIGYKSLEMTEIVQGVKEGDLLIINNQDLFKTGDRVTTRIVE